MGSVCRFFPLNNGKYYTLDLLSLPHFFVLVWLLTGAVPSHHLIVEFSSAAASSLRTVSTRCLSWRTNARSQQRMEMHMIFHFLFAKFPKIWFNWTHLDRNQLCFYYKPKRLDFMTAGSHKPANRMITSVIVSVVTVAHTTNRGNQFLLLSCLHDFGRTLSGVPPGWPQPSPVWSERWRMTSTRREPSPLWWIWCIKETANSSLCLRYVWEIESSSRLRGESVHDVLSSHFRPRSAWRSGSQPRGVCSDGQLHQRHLGCVRSRPAAQSGQDFGVTFTLELFNWAMRDNGGASCHLVE